MSLSDHVRASVSALQALGGQLDHIGAAGTELGRRLVAGSRLLAAGNGGSAAEAQHLTAELVGRFGTERRPLSALALHAETSSLTAITNDYGPAEAFARQVEAHGRPGDVLVAISTSGESDNVLAAVRRARACGLWTIGLTGPRPGRIGRAAETVIAVEGGSTSAVQEAHLVVVHLMCEVVDEVVAEMADGVGDEARRRGAVPEAMAVPAR